MAGLPPTREHAPTCNGALHNHVIYDKAQKGYRAQMRCTCSAEQVLSRVLHPGYGEAEEEVNEGIRPKDISADRFDAAVPPVDKRKRNHKPRPKPAPKIVIPPTPGEVRARWVAYWHTLSAKHGYESRLRG